MTATQYRIFTQGAHVDGFDDKTVREHLTAMFKLTAGQVDRILSGRRVVLKQQLDYDAAARIAAGFARAGLICEILPETGKANEAPVEPAADTDAITSAAVLIPAKTHPSILFTPVNCMSLSEQDGMLVTGRPDTGPISYHDLMCALVWNENSASGQGFRLVLFVRARRRPFEAMDTAIDFHSFEGVVATTAREGIRLLVHYLRDRNPGLRIDQATEAFLNSGQLRIDETRPLAHITALGTALIEQGAIRGD